MSSNFTPLNKRSKKEQRKYHAESRTLWPISPVTQITPSKKRYDRNRVKRGAKYDE